MADILQPLDDGPGFQAVTAVGFEGEEDAWEDDPEDESISFAIRDFVDAQ